MKKKKIKMRTELSIITPFHNIDLDVFEKTKKSVLSVLKDEWEWIIVLHNTTTITVEDMQKIFDGYSNVKIVAKEDDTCTPSSPRNTGLDVATSEYIYFLDGDDEVNGDFLLKALEKMKSDGDDIVIGKADVKAATEDVFVVPLQLDFPVQRDGYIVPHEPESMGKLLYGTPMMLACKVTKRSVIEDNHIRFDEDVILTEDMLFSFECYLKAKRICVLGDVVAYTYVQRGDSLLQSMMSKEGYGAKDYLLPIERIVDLAIKNNVSPSRYIWTMLGMFGAIAGNVQMEEQKKKELMQGIQKFLPLVNPEHMVSNKTYVHDNFVLRDVIDSTQIEENLKSLIEEYNKLAQIKVNKDSVSLMAKDISKLSAEQQSNVILGFQNIIGTEKSDIAVALLISGAEETKVIYKISMVISKALGKDCIKKAIRGDK